MTVYERQETSQDKRLLSHCTLKTTDQDWSRLIETNPAANIFHHPAWTQLLSTSYGYQPFVLAIRNSSGRVTATLPLMEISRFYGIKRWTALPFTDHCLPLSDDPSSLEALYRGLSEQYRHAGLAELEVRWGLPLPASAQASSRHVLHLLELEADPDRIHSRFHSTHRRNIKNAQKMCGFLN